MRWLPAPLAELLWEFDGASKLWMPHDELLQHEELLADRRVLLMMDSWCSRRPVLDLMEEREGLDMIFATRISTRMCGHPREHDGQARPADSVLERCCRDALLAGTREVLTELLGRERLVTAV